jgi:hypothetical protein
MSVPYQHTQRGTVIVVSLGLSIAAMVLLCAWIAIRVPAAWPPLSIIVTVTAAALVGAGWYFSSMTVTVTDEELRWHFGSGRDWVVRLADIAGVRIVPHRWFGGYGLRWFGPGRWVYIVSGNRAVEVALKQGGWRRLGTDDPDGLLRALSAGPTAGPRGA